MTIQSRLLAWFDENKRDLPWRSNRDPYAIWVSEIMLQQTQVTTVIPYFMRWMARFPTVEALAGASEQDVLSMWQGLGYYRRARLLHQGAQWVADHGMPDSALAWLKVPGVGRYTAGAISSIALGEAAALVDGNVERVFSRLTANPSTRQALNKSAWEWAIEAVDRERPGDWNQALMELGATKCRPIAPDCPNCPLQDSCMAYTSATVAHFPARTTASELIELEHVVWAAHRDGKFGLNQIETGKWWKGMWEFPRVEAANLQMLRSRFPDCTPRKIGEFTHRVTKHVIRIEAHRIEPLSDSGLVWFDEQQIEYLPLPAPQRKILRMLQARGSAV